MEWPSRGWALAEAENSRTDMVNIGHQSQDNLGRSRTQLTDLKSRFPGKVSDKFWEDLDRKVGDAGVQIQHVVDASVQVLLALGNIDKLVLLGIPPFFSEGKSGAALTIIGMDYTKDNIKSLDGEPLHVAIRLRELGERHDRVVEYLTVQNTKEISGLLANLEQLLKDYATKAAEFEKNFSNFTLVVNRLSAAAGSRIPSKHSEDRCAAVVRFSQPPVDSSRSRAFGFSRQCSALLLRHVAPVDVFDALLARSSSASRRQRDAGRPKLRHLPGRRRHRHGDGRHRRRLGGVAAAPFALWRQLIAQGQLGRRAPPTTSS